jgi:hypothetical protein
MFFNKGVLMIDIFLMYKYFNFNIVMHFVFLNTINFIFWNFYTKIYMNKLEYSTSKWTCRVKKVSINNWPI